MERILKDSLAKLSAMNDDMEKRLEVAEKSVNKNVSQILNIFLFVASSIVVKICQLFYLCDLRRKKESTCVVQFISALHVVFAHVSTLASCHGTYSGTLQYVQKYFSDMSYLSVLRACFAELKEKGSRNVCPLER